MFSFERVLRNSAAHYLIGYLTGIGGDHSKAIATAKDFLADADREKEDCWKNCTCSAMLAVNHDAGCPALRASTASPLPTPANTPTDHPGQPQTTTLDTTLDK